MRHLVLLVCLAGLISAAGCGRGPQVDPEEIPSLTKQEFVITPGMGRDAVEEVLGTPSDLGATKEGYTLAQYRFGYSVRSVVYDGYGFVVAAYPPDGDGGGMN